MVFTEFTKLIMLSIPPSHEETIKPALSVLGKPIMTEQLKDILYVQLGESINTINQGILQGKGPQSRSR